MSSRYPSPVDGKHRLLLYKIEDSILQGMPYDDEKCGTCRFYVGVDDIAYCNHMKLRILVGERWWCQWWEPDEIRSARVTNGGFEREVAEKDEETGS